LKPRIPRRLDKFVREASALPLRTIRQAWSDGRIRLHTDAPGVTREVLGLNHLVYAEDVVELDGQRLVPRTEHFTGMLNKPAKVTSSARDPLGQADLSPWLARMPPGAFAVGRLDRETTGLLLFTTDGELADAVLQPRRHTDKTYWLWLNEEFTPDDPRLARMTQPSADFDCAKHVAVHYLTPEYVELTMTLDQGKHHQIRRLCRALDLRLLHLHRSSVGPISLGELPLGDLRALGPSEVAALWAAVGGRERVERAQMSALKGHAQKARRAAEPDARLEVWLDLHAQHVPDTPED
jgi:pseudouridine synthase